VHALRLRNELPLQGQFPEPKGFYSGVGERVRETWEKVDKYPICNPPKRNLNNVYCIATTLSPTLSRATGEGLNRVDLWGEK